MTIKILIVEDDPFIAMDLQDTFEDAGFQVAGPAASVDAGLHLIEKEDPDIAMLDYNLGQETSIPIAQKLEKNDVPYAFLSGQIDRVVTSDLSAPKTVFSKPFSPAKIISYAKQLARPNII
ncbi:response regulator [Hellea balneolensis]|uniref:response regulator n=1 Tax=Hellea balneolensis TaxID=287478 RepID=UPI0003FA4841|nr:response regulator [Hellea balneolensis]